MAKVTEKAEKTKKPAPKQALVVDATKRPLGRLASEISQLLRGKNKPSFAPHNTEAGDRVNVINSDQVVLTGRKWTDKKYYSHSRYVGSLKTKKACDMGTDNLIREAVEGMLPKNKLRKVFLKRLRVYKTKEVN